MIDGKKDKLGKIEYISCPYCPLRYKHNTKTNRDAIEGHINRKHQDKDQIETNTEPTDPVKTEPDLKPKLSPLDAGVEVGVPDKARQEELERKRQELEQKLKELELKMNKD